MYLEMGLRYFFLWEKTALSLDHNLFSHPLPSSAQPSIIVHLESSIMEFDHYPEGHAIMVFLFTKIYIKSQRKEGIFYHHLFTFCATAI